MQTTVVFAQNDENVDENPVLKGLRSSFSLPWRDLLEGEHESEFRNLFSGLTVSTSFSYPLSRTSPATEGSGEQGSRTVRNKTLNLGLRYNPLSYWFANINFSGYFDKTLQKPWNPDFTYVFGYDDWHPWTLSLVYSNYGGNRLHPDRDSGERRTAFNQGAWSLGWKTPPPERIQRIFRIHRTSSIGCNVGLSVVPRFIDAETLEMRRFKKTVRFGCRYSFYKNWYINLNTIWYPDRSQQQPWDPDFTWGFGYFDWRPGKISIQYNNYAGNRYPWRDDREFTTRLKDGSISISWKWTF